MRSDTVGLIRLSHVPRWTIVPMFRAQTVAEHSFRTAAIAFDLAYHCRDIDSDAVYKIAWLALEHDVVESIVGDIPASAKPDWVTVRGHAATRQFSDLYHHIVKLADLLEALTYLYLFGVPTNRRVEIASGLVDKVVQASLHVPQTVSDRASELVSLITEDGVIDGQNENVGSQGGDEASGRSSQDNRDGGRDFRRSLLRLLPALPGGGGAGRGPDPGLSE